MDELHQLESAIAVLEAQRSLLGDEVVEVALQPLREKLARLLQEQAPQQRKLVTVLFADLIGYTSMAEAMDPEDVREILNDYFGRWRRCIELYNGMVEKYIGDAVMALFGLPVANEDDPERAIRAALDMRRELENLNTQLEQAQGLSLSMRVGIHTGPVVVNLVPDGAQQRFGVVGDTVNLASRLQEVAPVDGILISHDTYRHVRGIFSARNLDPVQVKGKQNPVNVYQVLRLKPRAFRIYTRGVQGVETRMVGRDQELGVLQEAFRTMLQNHRLHGVTIFSEAGLGKTRLIYEFDNWLDLLPERIYYFKGRVIGAMQNPAFSLLRDLFSYRFEIMDSDTRMEVWEKMERGIRGAFESTSDPERSMVAAHFIGQLLGFDFTGSPYLKGVLGDARQFHNRALSYLGEYFRALSQINPTVILLEDIHWGDDSSLEALNHLCLALESQPILLVCSARPAIFERFPHWGEGQDFHTRLELKPLGHKESRLLVDEILQRVEAVPAALRELVAGSAEGNPFYIEELIKMLIEEGTILVSEDRWQVEPNRLAAVTVPPSLVELLQARYDRLRPEERLVLQRAAVIGRTFWDRAVEFLNELSAVKITTDLSSVLEVLCRREMISQNDQSVFEGTQEYQFNHNLLRDVTYSSVLKRERRLYHARVGRWLEQVTLQSQRMDEYAAVIAGHYDQAGDCEQAIHWYTRAGDNAFYHFAHVEALRCFVRALALIPEGDLSRRYKLLLAREKIYDLQGKRQEQFEDLQILVSLADQLDQLGQGTPGQADGLSAFTHRAEVALRRAHYAEATGGYPAAISAAQEAVQISQAAGARESETAGHLLWGQALWRQANHAAAIERLELALALARETGLALTEADCLRTLGMVYLSLGKFPQAKDVFEQSLEIAHDLDDRLRESAALNSLGTAFYWQGDYPSAKSYYEMALRNFSLVGDRRGEGMAYNNLGVICQGQGDNAGARRFYEQALAICEETRDLWGKSAALNNLGMTCHRLGVFEAAEGYYKRAYQASREIGETSGEIAGISNLGWLAYHRGEFEFAAEYQRQAISAAQRCNNVYLESFAWMRLGRLLQQNHKLDEAGEAYALSLALRQGLNRFELTIEPKAGLASIAIAQGDLARARALTGEVLAGLEHPEANLLDNADDPYWVYLTCAAVLRAIQDPGEKSLVAAALELLRRQAAQIEDPSLRQIFLNSLPSICELQAFARG